MKKVVEKEKLYVVKKYIRARSAQHAIALERAIPVHDVWVEEDWKKSGLADAVGFNIKSLKDE